MRFRAELLVLLAAACGGSPPPTVAAPPATPPPPTSGSAVEISAPAAPPPPEDPYLWLEDVTGDRSLAWVKQRDDVTTAELQAIPGYTQLRDRIQSILDSKDKIAYVGKHPDGYYNVWHDDKNQRGLLRKTTLAEYKKAQPKWETVLDIDALGAAEHESWVFEGMSCLKPAETRCLVRLSRGGADATVVREFDVSTKKFIDDGFKLPEGKSEVGWKDKDTVYVGTDFGPGSMTSSGYPRIVKEWKRGTPVTDAKTLFEGKPDDVAVGAGRSWDHGHTIDIVQRSITAYTSETFVVDKDGKLVKLDTPIDAGVDFWDDQLLVTLRSDWTVGDKTWPRGALLAANLADFRAGKRDFTMLYEPNPHGSLAGTTGLKTALIVSRLEDVHDKLTVWTHARGKWASKDFALPASVRALDDTSVSAVDDDGTSDDYWMTSSGFVTPTTLYLGALGRPAVALKQTPAFFDAKGLAVEQHFATSADGTKVPYFQIARDGLALDGSHPTLLYGYGGFEISMTPFYSGSVGAAWLEHGGVYVLANIRGGGEYGPAWHQAALKHDRQRAYDDFIAIGQDLIARKVTTTPHLGIQGGSNGGLLMGVMLTERPDLWGAVVCQAPLLDMKRYHKLLAGASWMGEYGDPDNAEDWAALKKFSPYQNIHKDTKYPRTLFTSSTRDDRVHPGHARKMVARMLEQGHDVLYYENVEGGHGGAADNAQRAMMAAMEYAFLAKQLGLALQ
jgi:prolyl oligopeptidase|nr:prolyl oligopeptidase family serine peptidase [Kofleriaceae bacterium]